MALDASLWSGVGVPALTGVVTSGLMAGLVQTIFKARYDRRLESHKADLTATKEREIERIRADSTIAAERFKKSFGLLADRQAVVVEQIYSDLVDVHVALLQCLSPGRFGGEPSDADLLQTLHQTRWKGYLYFKQKRLFLPAELGAELDELYSKISGSEMSFRFRVMGRKERPADWDLQGELWEDANGPMSLLLRDMETKFRKLLSGERI